MRDFSLLSLAPLALLLSACGPGTTTVSCEVGVSDTGAGATGAHVCTQYDNEPVDAVTDFDGACKGVPGQVCSLTGVLGTCSMGSVEYVTTVTALYYSWGDGTAYDACVACTSITDNVPGVWTMPSLSIPVALSKDCPCTATSDCPSGQACQGGKCQ